MIFCKSRVELALDRRPYFCVSSPLRIERLPIIFFSFNSTKNSSFIYIWYYMPSPSLFYYFFLLLKSWLSFQSMRFNALDRWPQNETSWYQLIPIKSFDRESDLNWSFKLALRYFLFKRKTYKLIYSCNHRPHYHHHRHPKTFI